MKSMAVVQGLLVFVGLLGVPSLADQHLVSRAVTGDIPGNDVSVKFSQDLDGEEMNSQNAQTHLRSLKLSDTIPKVVEGGGETADENPIRAEQPSSDKVYVSVQASGRVRVQTAQRSQGPAASFMETFDSHSRTVGWSSEVLAARQAVEQHVGDLFDNDIDQVCHGSGHSSAGSSTNRLTILTVAVGLSTAFMDILRADRKRLADAFGYESCIVTHSLTDEREIVWSKLIAVRKLLEHGRSKIAWVDADALIMNPEQFEQIADPHFGAGKHVVFTNDFDEGDAEASPRSSINLGVFVTLNTGWTQKFWGSVYDEFPEALGHFWQEQQAVLLYRKKYPEDFESHTQIVRHRLMNSLLKKAHPTDFIVHAAGGKGNHGKYEQLFIYYCQRVHVAACHVQGSAFTEMEPAVDNGHEATTSKSEPLADGDHAIAEDALDKHGASGSYQVALTVSAHGQGKLMPVEGDKVDSVLAVEQQTMDHGGIVELQNTRK